MLSPRAALLAQWIGLLFYHVDASPAIRITTFTHWSLLCSDGLLQTAGEPFPGEGKCMHVYELHEGSSVEIVIVTRARDLGKRYLTQESRLSGSIKPGIGSSCTLRFDVTEELKLDFLEAGLPLDDPLRHLSDLGDMIAKVPRHVRLMQSASSSGPSSSTTNVSITSGSCTDPPLPFAELSSVSELIGTECDQILPLSSMILVPFIEGGLAAVCQAKVSAWTAEWLAVGRSLGSSTSWSAPVDDDALVAELCPATCASAGIFSAACGVFTPAPPSISPQPPSPPGLAADTLDGIRTALAANCSNGAIDVFIPGGTVLHLGGSPLVSRCTNVSIWSDEMGATIDAQHLSRVLEVHSGANVRLKSIFLANGYSADSGGGGISIIRAAVQLSNCTIRNSSALMGGAAAVAGGRLELIRSALSGSSATWGGALFAGRDGLVLIRASLLTQSSCLKV